RRRQGIANHRRHQRCPLSRLRQRRQVAALCRQHRCGTLFWLARLVELPASHPKKHLCGGFEERRSFAGRAAKRRRENSGREERLNSSHVAISYAVFCLKKKI